MGYLEVGINLTFYILILMPLLFFCKKNNRRYIMLFIIIYIINQALLRLGKMYIDLNWNWGGKVFSIVASLLFIIIVNRNIERLSFKDFNFTYKNNVKINKCIIFCLSFLIIVLAINYWTSDYTQKLDIETLLFQATMSGLDEEITYREIYLGLLNLVYIKKIKFLGTEFGFGLIITSILFALGHALHISLDNGVLFNKYIFLYTGIIGFLLGLLAETTKSLVLPIISHNTFNVINTLICIMR